MAKIANHKVLSAKDTVEQLISQSTKAPVKLVYGAKKTHDELSSEADDLEEFRIDLLKQYAETDEDGNVVRQTDEDGNPLQEAKFESDEDLMEFQEKLSDIYADEVSIDAHTVSVNEVGSYRAPAEWGKNLNFMLEGFDTRTESLRGGEVQASTDSMETILGIGNDGENPTLPLKFSAGLYRTYKDLLEAQEEIERRRFELLQEHAETDDAGRIVTENETSDAKFESDEAEEEFHEKLNEVYNEQFEVEANLIEIDYTDGVEIHPRHTIILDWMLTD
jgi:hypothetical protein